MVCLWNGDKNMDVLSDSFAVMLKPKVVSVVYDTSKLSRRPEVMLKWYKYKLRCTSEHSALHNVRHEYRVFLSRSA